MIAGYVLVQHPWIAGRAVEEVPNLLKGLGGDIVRYRLRDKSAGQGQVSETVEARYRAALKQLEQIQAGKLNIPTSPGKDETAGALSYSISTAEISGPPPQSDRLLEGY